MNPSSAGPYQPVCTSFREGQFGDHCVTCGVNYPIHPQADWRAVSRAKTAVRDAQDNPPPLNRAERRGAAHRPGAATPEAGPGTANGRDRLPDTKGSS